MIRKGIDIGKSLVDAISANKTNQESEEGENKNQR